MSKFKEIDAAVLRDAAAAIGACWNEGSPIAGNSTERWREIAHTAIRRIRSFDRRGIAACDRAAQIRDIGKGLVDQFEDSPELVGPLIVDYEYLAEKVLG